MEKLMDAVVLCVNDFIGYDGTICFKKGVRYEGEYHYTTGMVLRNEFKEPHVISFDEMHYFYIISIYELKNEISKEVRLFINHCSDNGIIIPSELIQQFADENL